MGAQINPEELKRILVGPDEHVDKEQFIIVHYRLVPSPGYTVTDAAARICLTTTLRTMRRLPYEQSSARLEAMGRVLSAKDTGTVTIAYPLNICSEKEGITQLFVIIAFGVDYGYTDAYWVDDIELPRSLLKRFRGPRFGIDGLRRLFALPEVGGTKNRRREAYSGEKERSSNIPVRPLIGVSIKPRRGVPLTEIAEACSESLRGGADFIVDDLLLVDPDGEMAFEKRVPVLATIAHDASLGQPKLYFANVSTSPFRALELAKRAKAEGVDGLVVNAFAMGFSALDELADSVGLPIITTNMGDGLLTRPNQPTGISAAVISKLSRLAGADAIHAGTSSSECFGPEAWSSAILSFRSGFHQLLPGCFAVAEGDITIADVWDNIYSLGPDVMLEACSGILEYPGGPFKGAQAFRTLVENLSHRMSLDEAHNKIMEIADRDPIVRQGLDYYNYQPKLDTP